MATTPNYGWVTPAPTDFVTDLPADFETFADAVDADLAGLLGGTTGQVLLKDSATDHDFSWGTPAAGGMTEISSGSLASSANIRIQSIPGTYKMLRLFIQNPLGSVTNFTPSIKFNNDTGSNYFHFIDIGGTGTTLCAAGTASYFNTDTSNTAGNGFVWIDIPDYASTAHWKTAIVHGSMMNDKTTAASVRIYRVIVGWNQNTAINEVDITAPNNFTSGNYVLYGVN